MRARGAGLIVAVALGLLAGWNGPQVAYGQSSRSVQAVASAQPPAVRAPAADEWPIERNAQQLRANEWKIGLFGLDVGVHSHVQLGTLWPTWAIAGPNVHLKTLFLARHGWSFGGELSFFYLWLNHLRWYGVDGVDGRVAVLPIELLVDKQVRPHLLLGLGTGYSISHASPQYNPQDLRGAGSYTQCCCADISRRACIACYGW